MKTVYNNLPETTRNAALKAKRTKRVNPYLYDVRKDAQLRELLTDAAEYGETVQWPVGAYMVDSEDPIENCYAGSVTWVLVSPKGKTRYCSNGLPAEDTTQWVKWVQKFLGIPQKTVKKSSTKRTKIR
jgi:hypothetical protein